MSPIDLGFKYPFGEESCEHEIEVLKDNYPKYYYDQGRFNTEVLDPDTYLIIGRRGSGKTSLAKYLEFQDQIKNSRVVDVDEPEVYEEAICQVATDARNGYIGDILTNRIAKVWGYAIWSLILNAYRGEDPLIEAACMTAEKGVKPARLIVDVLKSIAGKFAGEGIGPIVESVETYLSSAAFSQARKRVLDIASSRPIIVAIDTIERYDRNDDLLMCITAALVQATSELNIAYAERGIHIKTFVAAEIFPHLKEEAITNTTKYIRYPMHLHWRPKDLVRLICWRLYKYLQQKGQLPPGTPEVVDWGNFGEVMNKMWLPFFGREAVNIRRMTESSFPYLLRHTQLRPRQLVVLCNEIAKRSMQHETFPQFKSESIAQIIRETEVQLSDEVLNSYAKIYERVGEIIDSLHTSPMLFEGNYLDKVAKTTQHAWPAGEYSPANFRRLVAELGIVGRVRSIDEKRKIVGADFEYAMPDRLPLRSSDTCVIHPMFYSKLQTKIDRDLIVYPFPEHPDFVFDPTHTP